MKEHFKSVILDENWDRISYNYLSQLVVLLDIDEAYYYVKSAFKAFKSSTKNDTFTLQFVALIASNFLNCCYHQNAPKKYAQVAIDFIRSLPLDPVIGLHSFLATYYEALFNNDEKMKEMTIEVIKKSGYLSVIKDTLE